MTHSVTFTAKKRSCPKNDEDHRDFQSIVPVFHFIEPTVHLHLVTYGIGSLSSDTSLEIVISW